MMSFTATTPMFATPPGEPAVVKTLPVLKLESEKLIVEPRPSWSPPAALALIAGMLIVADAPPWATAVMVVWASMRLSVESPMFVYETDAPTSLAANVPDAPVRVVPFSAYLIVLMVRPGVPIAPTGTVGKVWEYA